MILFMTPLRQHQMDKNMEKEVEPAHLGVLVSDGERTECWACHDVLPDLAILCVCVCIT